MTNENIEIMEQETTVETTVEPTEIYEDVTLEEIENESGGGLGALLAIGATLVTVGGIAVTAVKKHKAKKANEPKKPKTKLKFFVRVPVEEVDAVEEVEAEPVEAEIVEDEKQK